MLVGVYIEEGRGTSNSTKYTPGPYTLNFFEDMYQGKSNIIAAS